MKMLKRFLLIAPIFSALILIPACGPKEETIADTGASLEGDVFFGTDKIPVAFIIVTSSGPGGRSAQGFADDDGHYKLTSAPLGLVKIAVNTDATKGQLMGRAMAGTDPNAKGGKKLTTPKVVEVPKKFHDPAGSGITTRVEKGENKFDIKIPK